MNLTRTLARNVCANWMGFAVQAGVAFFLTPFVLRTLGNAEYGIWVLLVSITGYYGLLDLGFRAGLTQYASRYLATKDTDRLNQTVSTGVCCLGMLGGLVCAVSAFVAWLAPLLFDFPAEALAEVRLVILMIGGGVAVQFPFFAFSAVLTAAQRFDLSNAAGVSTRLVTTVLTIVLLLNDYGIIGMAIATISGNLLDYLIRWRLAKHVVPELSVNIRGASIRSFWEFTAYGVWNVLIAGSRRLLLYGGTLVIGLFLPAAAIAPYVLAANLVHYFNDLIAPATAVFFPAATHLDAKGDLHALRRVYLVASRLIFGFAVAMAVVLMVWAEDFFRLWLKEGSTSPFGSVAVIFLILISSAAVTCGQRIGYQIMMGTRRMRQLTCLFALEAVANILTSVCLVQFFGVYGAAIGGLLPALIFHATLHPLIVSRIVNAKYGHTLLEIYLRPLIFAAVVAPALVAIRLCLPSPSGWTELVLHGILAGGLAMLAFPIIVLSSGERQRFVLQPLQRLYRRALPARRVEPAVQCVPARPESTTIGAELN